MPCLPAGRYLVKTKGAADQIVRVRPGETASVRLVVPREATGSGTIAGTVVDPEGAPVAGAEVRAGASRALPAITDDAGHFRLERLPASTYTIYASGVGQGSLEDVAVGTSDARVVIESSASVSGLVTAPGGAPDDLTIEYFEVVESGDVVPGFETFFHTSGVFSIRGLRAGTYELRAEAAGAKATTRVTLAEGERRTGVALALIAR
ncbi:MAG TPA: carboxypeptidase-like regulatory domain-containing protein [Kofleriaceae bacterium]|nr:carboxypeptidase-like regulatory domain-containing protein [Kofleriaceae bacterium]